MAREVFLIPNPNAQRLREGGQASKEALIRIHRRPLGITTAMGSPAQRPTKILMLHTRRFFGERLLRPGLEDAEERREVNFQKLTKHSSNGSVQSGECGQGLVDEQRGFRLDPLLDPRRRVTIQSAQARYLPDLPLHLRDTEHSPHRWLAVPIHLHVADLIQHVGVVLGCPFGSSTQFTVLASRSKPGLPSTETDRCRDPEFFAAPPHHVSS